MSKKKQFSRFEKTSGMASVPRIRAIINHLEKTLTLKQTEWHQKSKSGQVKELEKAMKQLTRISHNTVEEEKIPLPLTQRLKNLAKISLRLLRLYRGVSGGTEISGELPAGRKIVLEPQASQATLKKLAEDHEKLVQLGVVSKVARYIIMEAVFSLSNPVKLEDAVAAWQVYMQQAQKVYADAEIKHPKTHARNAPLRAAQFVLDMMRFVVFGTTNWSHEFAEEHVVCPYFLGSPNFIIGLVISSTLLCRSYSELLYALAEGFPDILPFVDICVMSGHVLVNIWQSTSAWVTRPLVQIENGSPDDSRPHLRIRKQDDNTRKHLVPQNQKQVIVDEGLQKCIAKSKGEWNMMASLVLSMTLRTRSRYLFQLTNFEHAFGMPQKFGEELATIYTINCTSIYPENITSEIYFELKEKWRKFLKEQRRNGITPSDMVVDEILGYTAYRCWKSIR